MAQDSLTKMSLEMYHVCLREEWKVLNDEQVEVHSTWKVEKGHCKVPGEALTIALPNPLLKKWEWVTLYPPFNGEMMVVDED